VIHTVLSIMLEIVFCIISELSTKLHLEHDTRHAAVVSAA